MAASIAVIRAACSAAADSRSARNTCTSTWLGSSVLNTPRVVRLVDVVHNRPARPGCLALPSLPPVLFGTEGSRRMEHSLDDHALVHHRFELVETGVTRVHTAFGETSIAARAMACASANFSAANRLIC